MKKVFTLLAGLMMLSASAETLTLYDEGAYLSAVPFNGLYADEVGNKTQVLYLADDLTAMVGKQISAITFYTEPEGLTLDGVTYEIGIAETDVNSLTDFITDGITKVGTVTMTPNEGQVVEVTITFNEPYTYNGGNLVFEDVVTVAGGMASTYWTGMNTNYNSALCYTFNSPTVRQFLPKTTFTYGGDTPAYEIGDVNHDEKVNIVDVTELIDSLLNGSEIPAEGDVDGDQNINIVDVTVLIDMLLGGN
jgi:hypothetical protein